MALWLGAEENFANLASQIASFRWSTRTPPFVQSGQEQAVHSEFIEQRNGGYYVAGTRISLDSVVYAFTRGDSPERILERYPLLGKPSRVYGAIAFYLDHQAE